MSKKNNVQNFLKLKLITAMNNKLMKTLTPKVDFKKVEKNINKNIDIFGRLGGEEFALIIKSNEKTIFKKIEHIRKVIQEISLHEDSKIIHFTVSVGLVKRNVNETLDMTLEKADKLLYEAKNCGRNQTKFRI